MMDSNWGDHNCFSKFMLDWLIPTVVALGTQTQTLRPTGTSPDAVLVMPEATGELFTEFFMAQYRRRDTGNDPGDYPNDGLIIWHVDATLNDAGDNFRYNNSDTEHKLLRLMEADGLEEIENNAGADAGDFYLPPATFAPSTTPNSHDYAGQDAKVQIDQLTTPTPASMDARFSTTDRPTRPAIYALGSVTRGERYRIHWSAATDADGIAGYELQESDYREVLFSLSSDRAHSGNYSYHSGAGDNLNTSMTAGPLNLPAGVSASLSFWCNL